jgi:uncharacterized protein
MAARLPRRLPESAVRAPPVTLRGIDFFVYSRATRSAAEVEHEAALDEEHWSYMDGFAAGMIARGPTLAADRTTWSGSVHILDLPSAEAARAFVEREPYNRAGLFEQHVIRRFRNLLGRTMWEVPIATDDQRFLVIAQALPDLPARERERLIVHGELLLPDDARPAGSVLAVQAPSRDAVGALLGRGQAGADEHVEIHDWELGGRR